MFSGWREAFLQQWLVPVVHRVWCLSPSLWTWTTLWLGTCCSSPSLQVQPWTPTASCQLSMGDSSSRTSISSHRHSSSSRSMDNSNRWACRMVSASMQCSTCMLTAARQLYYQCLGTEWIGRCFVKYIDEVSEIKFNKWARTVHSRNAHAKKLYAYNSSLHINILSKSKLVSASVIEYINITRSAKQRNFLNQTLRTWKLKVSFHILQYHFSWKAFNNISFFYRWCSVPNILPE